MAIVINDLLRSSFRCISQLRPGFGHSPSELVDGLFVLNSMLDSMATDDMNAYCEIIQNFTLIPGTAVYTIGPSGVWVGGRPTRIDKATLVVLTNVTQPLRMDIDLVNVDEWQSINIQSTQSNYPRKGYYQPSLTNGTLNLWPVPTTTDQVELSSSQTLAGGFSSGTDAFIAPPGYLEMVRYQLAMRLALEWDKPIKQGIPELASEALAKIQRLNAPTPQMDVNPGVLPQGGRGGWSRLTGD